uniref:Uncharacterized protein n=1 Tax=Panagrolaimus superbus TaxID=310955 RepID=A0A914Z876_9BILA
MLTEAGTVEKLIIRGICGKTPLSVASVEDIIAQVPNATYIRIFESHFTPTTGATLLSLKHNVKISNFILNNISIPITGNKLNAFLERNACRRCHVHYDFKLRNGDNDITRELNKHLNTFGWILTDQISSKLKCMK